MSIGRSILFLHNLIVIVHWYAVLVDAVISLIGEIQNTLYSSFFFSGYFLGDVLCLLCSVALFEKRSKPFSIVSLFSIIAMHPRVNLHIFVFQRGGSNVVETSPQQPSRDVGDHKHSFGSPN